MPHQSQPSRRPLQRLLLAVAVAFATVVATLAPTFSQPAVAATVGVLCSGFNACNAAGMSASGYHNVWDTMFWNMYSGRNCTNYVAYRMISAGMSSTRPSELKAGKGNASYWGGSFGTKTNAAPAVGAVAWWKANVPGAGSGGHVAYVEKVYSATDIVISESNWSGDFDWRRITTAANWPSGFIHLRDAGTPVTPTPTPTPTPAPAPAPTPSVTIPVSKGAPTISGTVAVGQTISASPGTWSQAGLTFAYRWYGDGSPLVGGTANTFTLTKGQLNKKLTVKVTATNSVGTAVATSATSPAVIPGTIGVTAPPEITGEPRIDETVTATPPVTTRGLATTDVQWYADSQPIAGANDWSLTLGPDEVARRLTVQVHGTRTAFKDVTVASAPTDPVQAPQMTVDRPGSVTGSPYVGSVLTAAPPATTPTPTATSYAWLRDGLPIAGATASTYRLTAADVGHHVSARIGLAAAGYYPFSQDYAFGSTITFPVVFKVHTAPGRHTAVVRVTVKSLRQLLTSGRVTVSVGQSNVTARVRGKQIVVHFDHLSAGRRPLKISYDGPASYQATVLKDHLRITR